MIGAPQARLGWAQAAALSLLLHGAAAAALVWQPDWHRADPIPDAPAQLQLDLSALAATQPDAPTLTPVTTPELGPDPASETLTPESPASEAPANDATELLTPLLTDPPLALVNTLPEAGGAGAAQPAPDPEPAESGGPADPRIAELFDRIRGRLSESCLLALPALLGEDQIQLGVLAADDRQIAGLMRELTRGLETEITEAAVLLDRRQCPALDFARRDPRYPVLGLGLQLEAQDIASGGNLRGRISGGAGLYTTLLLIDDNGVVHDLRRFQIASAGVTRFDVPLARSGAARDTHQLVLAIASPARPETVGTHAGELAEDFFDQLARDIAADARIGIGSVYVR